MSIPKLPWFIKISKQILNASEYSGCKKKYKVLLSYRKKNWKMYKYLMTKKICLLNILKVLDAINSTT